MMKAITCTTPRMEVRILKYVFWTGMVDWTLTPKTSMSYSLEPVMVTLYGKRDFADVIKNLETGRLSWMIWVGSNGITGVLMREGGRRWSDYRKEKTLCSFEGGGRGHVPRSTGAPKSYKRQGDRFSPPRLQNGERIHFAFVKPHFGIICHSSCRKLIQPVNF